MGAACCKPEVSGLLVGTRSRSRSRSHTPQAIDFDAEVNLFHFYLLRSVGKGAFGKVGASRDGPSS